MTKKSARTEKVSFTQHPGKDIAYHMVLLECARGTALLGVSRLEVKNYFTGGHLFRFRKLYFCQKHSFLPKHSFLTKTFTLPKTLISGKINFLRVNRKCQNT